MAGIICLMKGCREREIECLCVFFSGGDVWSEPIHSDIMIVNLVKKKSDIYKEPNLKKLPEIIFFV